MLDAQEAEYKRLIEKAETRLLRTPLDMNLYPEQMQGILDYIHALNEIVNRSTHDEEMVPYVDRVPVIVFDDLLGFIKDEIGGAYSFSMATKEEVQWWRDRPR